MKKQTWIVIFLMMASICTFAADMAYNRHGLFPAALGQELFKNWVQVPATGDYVRCTSDGTATHIESSAGWNITINNTGMPCIDQYDGTIYCAIMQYDDCVIGDSTYLNPPDNDGFSILLKISPT